MDKLSKRNPARARKKPKKRGDSQTSAARCVRPHALTGPASSLRPKLGREVETTRANRHCQLTCRHYDTFAGKPTLPNVTQNNYQKPAILAVAGKRRWRLALAIHDFYSKIICSRFIPKIPACGLTACVTRWWVGRDNAALTEPTSSQENSLKTRRLPPVGCTLC